MSSVNQVPVKPSMPEQRVETTRETTAKSTRSDAHEPVGPARGKTIAPSMKPDPQEQIQTAPITELHSHELLQTTPGKTGATDMKLDSHEPIQPTQSKAATMSVKSDAHAPIRSPSPIRYPYSAPNPRDTTEKTADGGTRRIFELMSDPLLIATMAMTEINEVFDKYTKLSRDLRSDDIRNVARAKSKLIQVYRDEYPELMDIVAGGSDHEPFAGHSIIMKFDVEADKVYSAAYEQNRIYFEDMDRDAVLSLFDPTRKAWHPPSPTARSSNCAESDDDSNAA